MQFGQVMTLRPQRRDEQGQPLQADVFGLTGNNWRAIYVAESASVIRQ
jgi:hypothetical protein